MSATKYSRLSKPIRGTGTKLEEMTLEETKVLEKLNMVSTAKRLAHMVCCCRDWVLDAVCSRRHTGAARFGVREARGGTEKQRSGEVDLG